MSEINDEPKYLNVRETAARLGVHENTVRNWVRSGILSSARLPGTKFHRFDEREVERLRRQRGAAVSSVKSDRRAINPELVGATQLNHWASTRDAQERFPELMRRLLASTHGVTNVSIRAGDGISTPGWDGRANAEGAPFLPNGVLCFEFSASGDPRSKADEDYEKRRDDPCGVVPAETIFVFATPRRWPGAERWASSRRREQVFADVRVLHADDLEGWLQATPPVHYWISERLGGQPRAVKTLENWWQRFRSQTRPALPGALFLAGREKERERLIELFSREDPDVISIQSAWYDEAIAFVCATIESLDRPEEVPPSLIVSSADAWNREIEQWNRMILMPLFDNPDIANARERGHHIILPLDRNQVTQGTGIILPPPHRRVASDALEAAGLDMERASRLAALSRRSMRSLVRRLSRDPRFARPRWSKLPDSAVLAPLALLGAWTSTEDDRDVVVRMAEEQWSQIERVLRHWLTTDDYPFVQSGTDWRLASPEEAFLVLAEQLTSDDLARWHDVAVDVLLEQDPTFELSPDERPMAEIRGFTRKYSSVLRHGIAEGIALIGAMENERLADGMTGADHARVLVHEILEKAEADSAGQIWSSLAHDVLPLLAEAAPSEFLDAVHADLDTEHPLLTTMFQDAERSSWIHSSSPHTGLLWALETVCWSSSSIMEACLALARLHEIDPGGQLTNRPLESLRNVLVGWIRHTSAPFDLRVLVLEAICLHTPAVGWALLLELWPTGHTAASPPSAPRFRDWKPDTPTVSVGEWVTYIGDLVRLAIELAGEEVERWAELAERVEPLPSAESGRVIEFLESVADPDSLPEKQRILLWERLHEVVSRQKLYRRAGPSLGEESLARMERIVARLEPVDSIERFGYLFDWRPTLPDVDPRDHAAHDERLSQLRTQAVHEALANGSLEGIRHLAQHVAVPQELGRVLGAVASEELTPRLLEWLDSPDEKILQVARSWASCRLHEQGATWLRKAIARPVMKSPQRRIALALCAPRTRDVWHTLEDFDEDLARAYWDSVSLLSVAPEDVEFATSILLDHNRPWAAMEILAGALHRRNEATSTITPKLVETVLDAAMTSDPSGARTHVLGYEVAELLNYLEAEGADVTTLAHYEFAYFHLLDPHRKPTAFFAALGTDPTRFVDLVKRVYRGKNEPKRRLDEGDEALARHAWWILQHWSAVPGQGEDGVIDSDHLTNWVRQARQELTESDREDVGDEVIGQVLAASPSGSDDVWPAEAVREVVEEVGSQHLEAGLYTGRLNSRGVTTRGLFDGGQQERELASRYREWSKQVAGTYPRTSRLLRRFADHYELYARKMDEEAEVRSDI